jgi:hypothetical protein
MTYFRFKHGMDRLFSILASLTFAGLIAADRIMGGTSSWVIVILAAAGVALAVRGLGALIVWIVKAFSHEGDPSPDRLHLPHD